mmetsp:Transcript_31777/g.99181  ORF Transcript_31777/g.99181 Transcript_31777/m.99181 type:complete len:170 (+) Transcript_31777:1038-1547(+)
METWTSGCLSRVFRREELDLRSTSPRRFEAHAKSAVVPELVGESGCAPVAGGGMGRSTRSVPESVRRVGTLLRCVLDFRACEDMLLLTPSSDGACCGGDGDRSGTWTSAVAAADPVAAFAPAGSGVLQSGAAGGSGVPAAAWSVDSGPRCEPEAAFAVGGTAAFSSTEA